ncbi:hypothetical protein D3C80_1637780 [compost metagenome]
MLLAHHHVQLAGPDSVMLAEPAVLEALRLAQAVLLPKQRQGHARSAQFGMHPGPIGQWPLLAGHHRGGWKQLVLQLDIGQRTGPGEAAGGETTEVVTGTAVADAQTAGNLADGEAAVELEA